ncbi:MAG: PilZ domain-containing protein [Gracilibacteraceae bacterium]|nr:PilZ domain-containing protein [Gracilibacteraceae bacterium]
MKIKGTETSKPANVRKSKRIDYYSKIYCTKSIQEGRTEEYDVPIELMLINISIGGLGIISERIFEKDTVLVLDLKLEEVKYEKVYAKVMWVMKMGDMYRHGLEIFNVSGRLYKHLGALDNSIRTTV